MRRIPTKTKHVGLQLFWTTRCATKPPKYNSRLLLVWLGFLGAIDQLCGWLFSFFLYIRLLPGLPSAWSWVFRALGLLIEHLDLQECHYRDCHLVIRKAARLAYHHYYHERHSVTCRASRPSTDHEQANFQEAMLFLQRPWCRAFLHSVQ